MNNNISSSPFFSPSINGSCLRKLYTMGLMSKEGIVNSDQVIDLESFPDVSKNILNFFSKHRIIIPSNNSDQIGLSLKVSFEELFRYLIGNNKWGSSIEGFKFVGSQVFQILGPDFIKSVINFYCSSEFDAEYMLKNLPKPNDGDYQICIKNQVGEKNLNDSSIEIVNFITEYFGSKIDGKLKSANLIKSIRKVSSKINVEAVKNNRQELNKLFFVTFFPEKFFHTFKYGENNKSKNEFSIISVKERVEDKYLNHDIVVMRKSHKKSLFTKDALNINVTNKGDEYCVEIKSPFENINMITVIVHATLGILFVPEEDKLDEMESIKLVRLCSTHSPIQNGITEKAVKKTMEMKEHYSYQIKGDLKDSDVGYLIYLIAKDCKKITSSIALNSCFVFDHSIKDEQKKFFFQNHPKNQHSVYESEPLLDCLAKILIFDSLTYKELSYCLQVIFTLFYRHKALDSWEIKPCFLFEGIRFSFSLMEALNFLDETLLNRTQNKEFQIAKRKIFEQLLILLVPKEFISSGVSKWQSSIQHFDLSMEALQELGKKWLLQQSDPLFSLIGALLLLSFPIDQSTFNQILVSLPKCFVIAKSHPEWVKILIQNIQAVSKGVVDVALFLKQFNKGVQSEEWDIQRLITLWVNQLIPNYSELANEVYIKNPSSFSQNDRLVQKLFRQLLIEGKIKALSQFVDKSKFESVDLIKLVFQLGRDRKSSDTLSLLKMVTHIELTLEILQEYRGLIVEYTALIVDLLIENYSQNEESHDEAEHIILNESKYLLLTSEQRLQLALAIFDAIRIRQIVLSSALSEFVTTILDTHYSTHLTLIDVKEYSRMVEYIHYSFAILKKETLPFLKSLWKWHKDKSIAISVTSKFWQQQIRWMISNKKIETEEAGFLLEVGLLSFQDCDFKSDKDKELLLSLYVEIALKANRNAIDLAWDFFDTHLQPQKQSEFKAELFSLLIHGSSLVKHPHLKRYIDEDVRVFQQFFSSFSNIEEAYKASACLLRGVIPQIETLDFWNQVYETWMYLRFKPLVSDEKMMEAFSLNTDILLLRQGLNLDKVNPKALFLLLEYNQFNLNTKNDPHLVFKVLSKLISQYCFVQVQFVPCEVYFIDNRDLLKKSIESWSENSHIPVAYVAELMLKICKANPQKYAKSLLTYYEILYKACLKHPLERLVLNSNKHVLMNWIIAGLCLLYKGNFISKKEIEPLYKNILNDLQAMLLKLTSRNYQIDGDFAEMEGQKIEKADMIKRHRMIEAELSDTLEMVKMKHAEELEILNEKHRYENSLWAPQIYQDYLLMISHAVKFLYTLNKSESAYLDQIENLMPSIINMNVMHTKPERCNLFFLELLDILPTIKPHNKRIEQVIDKYIEKLKEAKIEGWY